MQYCAKCNVNIRGNKRCCPLCQGKIKGDAENPAFKTMPVSRVSGEMFIKLAIFAFLITNIVMFALQILYRFELHWPVLVTVFSLFALGDILVAFYLRGNILNLITVQSWIIMGIVYFLDRRYSGYLGYSVAWVVPILFIVLVISTIVIGKLSGMHTVDYAILIMFDVILSLFQIIPIANGNNPFPVLSVISMALMLGYLAYIVVFRGRDLKSAAEKYLNM